MHPEFNNHVARAALWLSQREAWLRRHGLSECSECKSWIRNTHEATHFHFRRCEG